MSYANSMVDPYRFRSTQYTLAERSLVMWSNAANLAWSIDEKLRFECSTPALFKGERVADHPAPRRYTVTLNPSALIVGLPFTEIFHFLVVQRLRLDARLCMAASRFRAAVKSPSIWPAQTQPTARTVG